MKFKSHLLVGYKVLIDSPDYVKLLKSRLGQIPIPNSDSVYFGIVVSWKEKDLNLKKEPYPVLYSDAKELENVELSVGRITKEFNLKESLRVYVVQFESQE